MSLLPWEVTSQQNVEYNSEGPDVMAYLSNETVRGMQNFGRNVRDGSRTMSNNIAVVLGHAKVAELGNIIVVNHYVLGLDVAMGNVPFMQMLDSTYEMGEVAADLRLSHALSCLNFAEQVTTARVLLDHHNAASLSLEAAFGLNNVGMVELLAQIVFVERSSMVALIWNDFNGRMLASHLIKSKPDIGVGAMSELLDTLKLWLLLALQGRAGR